MKSVSRKLRFVCLTAMLAGQLSIASAAIIHRNDDTIVTGDLQSITAGKLTVRVNNAPVLIPLDDISQITLKEPPPPVVAKPPPVAAAQIDQDDGPNLGAALFGALFSGARPNTTPAPAAATTQPAAPTPSSASTKPAATQPAVAHPVQLILTDGDQLHATLEQWSDQKLSLHLIDAAKLQLPASLISQIWFGSPDQQTKARALNLPHGPEDIAYVAKENDIIPVKGIASEISSDALVFRYADQDRKINLSKLVGVQLQGSPLASQTGFHQAVHTDNGDRLSGQLISLDHENLTLSLLDASIKIPLSTITTIDFVNGKVTSLCDLKPTKVEQSAYFGRLMTYQTDKSLTGGPLILSDGPVTRGIAVHSRCVLQYEIPSGIDRFRTRLGFASPDGQLGRVAARILADTKPLYENPDARGNQPPIDIDLPITGIHTLTLEIDFGKDQDTGDRVIWANPRLIRGK